MSAFPEHLQGLLHPRAYPHPVQAVHLVETHISWILLTGEFAYKIKRPVHYPFVDLRSAERREKGMYSHEASTRVYQHLAQCAADTLAGGYTTIIDATFQRREDRAHFHGLSVQLGIAACLVHCEASPEVLRARVDARRRRGDDPSDADLSVLQWQEVHCEPIQAEESFVLFEAVTDRGDVVNTLIRQIGALRV